MAEPGAAAHANARADVLAPLGRTRVLGIVNVTPDSFSDGGRWLDPAAAVAHGRRLAAEGADLVDVGGESTRPGAARVSVAEELRRVIPVVAALAADGIAVSVDTMRAAVAQEALAAGAAMINDVSGGLAEPALLGVMADSGAPYVCMHWRGHADGMQDRAVYTDVAAEVAEELAARAAACLAAGVRADRLVLDPGIGFAKTAAHNWALIAGLDRVAELGYPLLLGVSRKRFLSELATPASRGADPLERDHQTLALTTIFAERGAWAVRTHVVAANRDAVAVVQRLRSL